MTGEELSLNRQSTALVIIDLQNGIVGRQTKPNPSTEVVKRAARLVETFRRNSMPIFFVHVDFSKGLPVNVLSDTQMSRGEMPANWMEFVPELGVTENDLIITKRQWGAFYGTDLDQQLRRRKIDTIVLCGISTSYGVQSTARFAYEYGYNQVFVEDAMSDSAEDAHRVSVEYVLKRMGRVRSTQEVVNALS